MRLHEVWWITRGYLESALYAVNEAFENNVSFNDIREIGDYRWHVTLRASTSGPGHSLSRPEITGRAEPISSACWHVQKMFFEFLPDYLEFPPPVPVEDRLREVVIRIGRNDWYPRIAGYFPTWQEGHLLNKWDVTDLCECDHDRTALIASYSRKKNIGKIGGF
jgi:hypothetical protein